MNYACTITHRMCRRGCKCSWRSCSVEMVTVCQIRDSDVTSDAPRLHIFYAEGELAQQLAQLVCSPSQQQKLELSRPLPSPPPRTGATGSQNECQLLHHPVYSAGVIATSEVMSALTDMQQEVPCLHSCSFIRATSLVDTLAEVANFARVHHASPPEMPPLLDTSRASSDSR